LHEQQAALKELKREISDANTEILQTERKNMQLERSIVRAIKR
jgi:hypothetical protein